jgi:hypothetical protein
MRFQFKTSGSKRLTGSFEHGDVLVPVGWFTIFQDRAMNANTSDKSKNQNGVAGVNPYMEGKPSNTLKKGTKTLITSAQIAATSPIQRMNSKSLRNEAIVSVEEHDDNAVIIDRIKARLNLGLGIYGHGVQVESSEYNWMNMAEEEVLDGLIYTAAAILKREKQSSENQNKRASEIISNLQRQNEALLDRCEELVAFILSAKMRLPENIWNTISDHISEGEHRIPDSAPDALLSDFPDNLDVNTEYDEDGNPLGLIDHTKNTPDNIDDGNVTMEWG